MATPLYNDNPTDFLAAFLQAEATRRARSLEQLVRVESKELIKEGYHFHEITLCQEQSYTMANGMYPKSWVAPIEKLSSKQLARRRFVRKWMWGIGWKKEKQLKLL